jgi:hypothetical protein
MAYALHVNALSGNKNDGQAYAIFSSLTEKYAIKYASYICHPICPTTSGQSWTEKTVVKSQAEIKS